MIAGPLDTALFARLCDDAAVFPPGNLPLGLAVPEHLRHRQATYAGLIGPLVVAATHLGALAQVTDGLPTGSLDLALTVPLPQLGQAVTVAEGITAARLTTIEVALPDGTGPDDVVPALERALRGRLDLTVFVEVPRDERREPVLQSLAGAGHLAKFRTGGVRAELHPGEAELAGAVLAAVWTGVPFKATAGLHHALRNTDPESGFEQHGFLNLLAATGAALDGADHAQVVALLAERDGARVVDRVRALPPRVREVFRSFGTCSIAEPVAELVDLGLLTLASAQEAR